MQNGVLVFNPGTVTNQFPATYGSFGVLTVATDGAVTSEIIHLESQARKHENLLQKLLAIIIRNGIRWLESWP